MEKIIALLSVTLFMLIGCFQRHEYSLEMYNNSDHKITVRLTSKTTGEQVGYRHPVKSNNNLTLYQAPTDFWKTAIEDENGLIMRVFPKEYHWSPSDSLDDITPLKEWDIPDWESVKSVKGDFYYP